jgi:LuxR family transcriptional activator of bioluminescence operon
MEKIITCIETISEADSIDIIEQELLSLTQFFDYDFYLLGLSVPESVARSKVLIYNNYPEGWREYYDKNNLANVDPIVKHCFENTEPVHWHQILNDSLNNKELKFFKEAAAAGLCSGISVPVHGSRSEFGMLSFASRKPVAEIPDKKLNKAMLWAQIVAPIAFSRIVALVGYSPNFNALTPRENSALLWAAEGKTTWEIARILECSERTVFFHIDNATKKLQAANRYQAISKAILLGYIQPEITSNDTEK